MVTIHSGDPDNRVTGTSIPIMDKEIKISVSKRDLTYTLLSFIMILLSLYLGYRIGNSNTASQVQSSESGTRFIRPHNGAELDIQQLPNNLQLVNSPTQGEGAASDVSWAQKSKTTTTISAQQPYVESYNYYSEGAISNKSKSELNDAGNEPVTGGNSARAYVASKNGAKYYPVGCKSADRIKPENRVYFVSAEEAEIEGLEPSTTCK